MFMLKKKPTSSDLDSPTSQRDRLVFEMTESVKEMVCSFRSIKPGGKLNQEYQDIAKRAISRLHQRVREHNEFGSYDYFNFHKPPHDKLSQFENETLYNLGHITLPKLKEDLKLLSIATGPTRSQDGTIAWYDEVVDTLAGIDEHLVELDDSIRKIGHSPDAGPGPRDKDSKIQNFTLYTAEQTRCRIKGLLRKFSDILSACGKFFDDSRFSDPSIDKSLVIPKAEKFTRLTAMTTENIDDIVKWLENSLLDAAREEWRHAVKHIGAHVQPFREISNARSHTCTCRVFEGVWDESGSDDEMPFFNQSDESQSDDDEIVPSMESVNTQNVVLKLCRIYFEKLSRPANRQPLVSVGPLIRVQKLKLLLHYTHEANGDIVEFLGVFQDPERQREALEKATIYLIGGFVRISRGLWKYWGGLLETKDPRVNQAAIEEARHWLDFWFSQFFLATATAMGSPGYYKGSWLPLADGKYFDEEFYDNENSHFTFQNGWADSLTGTESDEMLEFERQSRDKRHGNLVGGYDGGFKFESNYDRHLNDSD
ncbi:hypothetical protein PSTG_14115 [Puccinia striiformis f. sp. tritici PST-78]|uniref:Uncharacterized protein n=1 Tax=Puccinia striiformis f. sp. tritici PST-78 TaxID=1165861 RepID=A0A0L0V0J3_9BASI|nr:hypothetical protein PSTG_14115 [Puccinia striiformis f. sp. tritici PST-78]